MAESRVTSFGLPSLGTHPEDHGKSPELWDPLAAWPRAGHWIWLCMALLAGFVMAPAYLATLRPPAGLITDFYQEWASARNYLNGDFIYSDQRATIPHYLHKQALSPHDRLVEVNGHPPTAVLLAMPFARLSFRGAALTWNVLSLGMLLLSLGLVRSELRIPVSIWSAFPAATLLLFCTPLFIQLRLGQLNLILLLLLTAAWAADRSGRPWLAGACVGTAASIKLFPGLLLFYFILRGQWRAVLAGVISVIAWGALTAGLYGLDAYQYYFLSVVPRVARFRGLWFNASLVGFWTKLFDPPPEYPYVTPLWPSKEAACLGTVLSCTAIVMILASVVRRAKSVAERDLAFGLAVTAMLLVSPITWDHYLLLSLVPLAVAWVRLPGSDAARIVLSLIVLAFWSWPLRIDCALIPGFATTGLVKPVHTLTLLSYQCYALLALFALILVEFRGCGRIQALSQDNTSQS